MNSLTLELNRIRNDNQLFKVRFAELEQENALLVSQIDEMVNEQTERDAIINEFGTAVETRITEWKDILDEKDVTIAKLKENLLYSSSDKITNASGDENSRIKIERLIKDINHRDEIIAELQNKLSEAVIELNESSLLFEKVKSDHKTVKQGSKDRREINKKMQEASKKVSVLENLLERAENDAKIKSEQLCDALAILNKYEDENTSLTESLGEIKELKFQVKKKCKHIEDMVDIINKLELENSRFEEVIIILRDKLGVTKHEESLIEDLILQRQESQKEKFNEMQRENNRLTGENADLKFQLRKVKATFKESLKNKLNAANDASNGNDNVERLSSDVKSKQELAELYRIKENVKWVIEENEALRQGMHEILDCIHKQDGKSVVTIQSQTLENLLEALDARHLAGWYHPAMRLQGRVNYLQGSNAELRAQLQQIRKNQMLFQADVQLTVGSVEEGECTQQRHSTRNITPDGKIRISIFTVFDADSGRASGKAVEIDDIQETEGSENTKSSESGSELAMDDEEFGKSEEVYSMTKEVIAQEGDFKQALTDSIKHQKILEYQLMTLRKNLANCISPEIYNELRGKYLETNMRLRAAFENKLAISDMEGETKAIEVMRNKVIQEQRDELISVHKLLSELTIQQPENTWGAEKKIVEKLESRIVELTVENDALQKSAEIAREETVIHRAIDSTVLTEFNDLRQRISKLEANEEQELKKTAQISLELANYKVKEIGLREEKKLLENELLRMRDELANSRKRQRNNGELCEMNDKQIDIKDYIEIIDILQHQYAGSTSLSAWERYEANSNQLRNDQNEVKKLIIKINDQNENLKIQHETLASRLQIVEQLKDILEQQIGSSDVQDIMQKFTNETKLILAESQYKTTINQLEEEMKIANKRLSDYEIKVASMEQEINKAQKIWTVQKISSIKRPLTLDKIIETDARIDGNARCKQTETKSSQTRVNMHSVEVQCMPCESTSINVPDDVEKDVDDSEIVTIIRESSEETLLKGRLALLQEQLGQALNLASERSIALSKCESQLAEYNTRNATLVKLLDERSNAMVADHVEVLAELSKAEEIRRSGPTSQEALQSTVNSLRKIVEQKEETIARYQNLLKEDRDIHNEDATRLHEEIKCLKKQISVSRPATRDDDNALIANSEYSEKDWTTVELVKSERKSEEASILRERVSRLETELSISGELADRWHRLADDRLRHMDSTRERLEDQHKEEIDSYRMELNKRESEIDELRRQLLESRRAFTTKTEVLSFMKTLQIKDNRLADEIENELEEHMVISSKQIPMTRDGEDPRHLEFEQSSTQLDNLRKQVQILMEREKSYKSNITELQQLLSRKYMASKSQEKKVSRREMQLERKVKELEKELSEAREMLDRHFMMQQAKRVKTAEDLGLWEKLKKWQQTAEKLKEKLKEKSDECQRLQNNYEKLRNLISCIEREKWFLKGKYRNESIAIPAWMPPPDLSQNHVIIIEDLQRECQELRERVKELVDRLNYQDNEKSDDNENMISPSDGIEVEEYSNNELKRLSDVDEVLEKENLRLEAENFELNLELERANLNLPRYQDKIQHLEKYIELLKSEKSIEPCYTSGPTKCDSNNQRTKNELERTVLALKNLVEKLQQDNKTLRQSFSKEEVESCRDCRYVRAEWEQSERRVRVLESELELAEKRMRLAEEAALERSSDDGSEEAAILREQLTRKSELLLKVKDLLAKAALNEKALRQRIQQLEFKQTLSIIPEYGSSLEMT
ncbi:PREDICTED: centrosomal protein of 290 kDa-like [Ceratosolen solmsi marchali]|uniref:Centrosomal protein of 290 kDa-like n=1 Tax=Ceratosolen solmsi marchali TaxID=326594 RepID=A0AAJ7E1U0_9HYME|nr:PREDICTED: centrosomal protein of 290 kDa-like [Ceratosolen solmsi marchali]